MNYAIIAAGEGSRLAVEGITVPKPLVPIQGTPMLVRLLDMMCVENAETISIIVNPQMPEVLPVLRAWQAAHSAIHLRICQQGTPSSMHSFSALSAIMPAGPFVLTTVDTLFQAADFHRFVQRWETLSQTGQGGAAATADEPTAGTSYLFGVTRFVDDEKPLWIDADAQGHITAFADQGPLPFVSGGLYAMHTRTALPVLQQCLAQGQSRMRNYQRALLSAGLTIEAFEFPKIMDIDHAADLQKAEAWLQATASPEARPAHDAPLTLLVARAPEFSPNNVGNDAAILHAVGQQLEQRGHQVAYVSETALTREIIGKCGRVYSMARRWKSLMLLQQYEQQHPGAVVNPTSGVQITTQSRSTTLELLEAAGVQVPPYWAYEPSSDDLFQCEPHLQQLLPGWLKAMRPAGVTAGDVQYLTTPLEADTQVLTKAAEGYTDMVVMRHCEGQLLKAYAVCRHGQLLWTNRPEYAATAERIAQALHLQVFGFDLMVDAQQQAYVIDVNDWPSFSPCRDEAAKQIANLA